MNFREAYNFMLQGKKVKRPCFKGWWEIDKNTGVFVKHIWDSDELTESDSFSSTIINALATDWEIY